MYARLRPATENWKRNDWNIGSRGRNSFNKKQTLSEVEKRRKGERKNGMERERERQSHKSIVTRRTFYMWPLGLLLPFSNWIRSIPFAILNNYFSSFVRRFNRACLFQVYALAICVLFLFFVQSECEYLSLPHMQPISWLLFIFAFFFFISFGIYNMIIHSGFEL